MSNTISTDLDRAIARLDALAQRGGGWFLTKGTGYIRRTYYQVDDNGQRRRRIQLLPATLYRHMSMEDRGRLVEQILRRGQDTAEVAAREHYRSCTSFIPESLLTEYLLYLEARIPSRCTVSYNIRYVRKYFIHWFSQFHPDPRVWYRSYQDQWGTYLQSTGLSMSVILKVLHASNRLMRYMHRRSPETFPLLVFEPLSRATMSRLAAVERLGGGNTESGKYIEEEEVGRLVRAAQSGPAHLVPYIQIGYYYGLRRSEIVGLVGRADEAVRRGYLLVDRQYKAETGLTVTKHGSTRRVPHWYMSAEQCAQLISDELTHIRPDTLSKQFSDLAGELARDCLIRDSYTMHHLRHSFITRAAQQYSINDVRLAAGHCDVSVTSRYLRDARDLDDAPVIRH